MSSSDSIVFKVDPNRLLKEFKSNDLKMFGVNNESVSPEFLEFAKKHDIIKQPVKEGDPRIILRAKTVGSAEGLVSCFVYEGDKVESQKIPELKNSGEYWRTEDFENAKKLRQEAIEEARLYGRKNGWKVFQDFFGRENITRAGRNRVEGTIWKAGNYKLQLKFYGTTRESSCLLIPAVWEADIELLDEPIEQYYDPELDEEFEDIFKLLDLD